MGRDDGALCPWLILECIPMAKDTVGGKVVVITGASSGFGKGAAREFARGGAHVVLAARRGDLLNELARECESIGEENGVRALAVPTDVSNPEAVERLGETVLEEFGRFDVWVNDAGVAAIGRFEEVPLEDHLQVIMTDLVGTLCGSYVALREFRARGAGTLINISSELGKMPAPYYASYAAAKHGVLGLGRAIRQELLAHEVEGIKVCTVLPMAMDTPFFEHAANYTGRETRALPPVGVPERVVEAIVRLVTEPEDEVMVGGTGRLMAAAHALMPKTIEGMMARKTKKDQIDKAPRAAPTRGAVRGPMRAGSEVRGGWKDTRSKARRETPARKRGE